MSEELEIRDTSTSGTSESVIEEECLPRSPERKSNTPDSLPRGIPPSRHRVGAKTAQAKHPKPIGSIGEAIVDGLWNGIKFATMYNMNLVVNTLHYLRQPLAIFMSFYVLICITGYISQTISQTLSPMCAVPGLSRLSVCRARASKHSLSTISSSNMLPKLADYLMLMDIQSKSFEDLLQESSGGSRLSLEIKMAEMATSDLLARLRVSDLSTRNNLAASLTGFITDAKKTARRLQRLTSKIGGAVDNIIAVNDHSFQLIRSARAKDLSRWLFPRNMNRWDARSVSKHTDEVIAQVFDRAMNALSVNMERLILEAEHNLQDLNNLEEKLSTLHEIILHEDSVISVAKSDLVDGMWTRLGGNRGLLRKFDYHLAILKGLASYREQALVRVISTIQTLLALSEDMEDMRERVALPDLIGATVPVEVHINSIQAGLARLRDGRIRAKEKEENAVRRVLVGGDGDGSGTALSACVPDLHFEGGQCPISL